MIDVAIEDLTVMVLIHELAHGYTHNGRDIDGASWGDYGFRESDLGVVEVQAQFYHDELMEWRGPFDPKAFDAIRRRRK